MKLHFNPASPYVRIVRVTAHELGIFHELELVQAGIVSPIEAHPNVTVDNPLGKVPTLVTDHGTALYDSRVICEYLVHHAGDLDLLPHEPVSRFRILTLQTLAQGIADAALLARYEGTMRPEELRWQEWTDRQLNRIETGLRDLEQNWLGDLEGITVGTISAAVALSYLLFRFDDIDWRAKHAGLADFYGEFSKRPSMQATELQNPS